MGAVFLLLSIGCVWRGNNTGGECAGSNQLFVWINFSVAIQSTALRTTEQHDALWWLRCSRQRLRLVSAIVRHHENVWLPTDISRQPLYWHGFTGYFTCDESTGGGGSNGGRLVGGSGNSLCIVTHSSCSYSYVVNIEFRQTLLGRYYWFKKTDGNPNTHTHPQSNRHPQQSIHVFWNSL